MSMPRCDLTELPVDQCAHCRKLPDPDAELAGLRRRLLTTSHRGWFPAVYAGTCRSCGERFQPGTAIRLDRESPLPTYEAECCAEGAT